jgi:hypothetical protein
MLRAMPRLSIKWRRIAVSDELRRSSQTIGVVDGRLGVFGGELEPRVPVDNKVYHVDLKGQGMYDGLLVGWC